jgi:hypothetical protein
MVSTRRLFMALAIVFLGVLPGCIGHMTMTQNVREFNMTVVEDMWGREVLFVGLIVVPFYPIALLGDVLLVNSIEFWSGSNPISREPALVDERVE